MESVLPLLYMVAISSVYFFLIPQTILTDWPACGHLLGWCRAVVLGRLMTVNHPFLQPLPAAKVSVEPADFGGFSKGCTLQHAPRRRARAVLRAGGGCDQEQVEGQEVCQEAGAGPLRRDQLPEEGEEVQEDCNAALVKRERGQSGEAATAPPLVGSASS